MPAEHDDGRDAPDGRDPAAHAAPDGPPPADSPPTLSVNFDDLRDKLRRFGMLDPITPAEAAEELDDLESDDDDPADHRPGSRRTWAELDACVEAERRCDLDFIEAAFMATEKFCRPVEEPDGGTSLRFLKSPHVSDDLGNEIERSLRELHKAVVVVARRYAEHG